MARTMSRSGATAVGALLAAGLLLSIAPVDSAPLGGVQTFGLTGADQTFTVPAGVTAVTADLFGARGGTALEGSPPSTQNGGLGGEATGTLVVTPGQVLEVVVGGAGHNGSQNGGAAGGFNGGGDGSTDVDGAAPGGGGGGGSTDVRAGSCTTPTPTCTFTSRVLVAGGGGGAGGGSTFAAAGGAGGGASGLAGTDVPGAAGSGGGGATQGGPGSGGLGSSAGTAGDLVGRDGGPGGGGGGGGGGGLHGGGGGAASNVPNGAGGGGGSGFGGAGTHLLTSGNSAGADGAATIYWITFSPTQPSSGQPVTFTSHLAGAAIGGTETFIGDNGAVCSNVPVTAGGTATCTAPALPPGPHSMTASYTAGATGSAQFDATHESVTYQTVAPTTTTTVAPTTTVTTVTPTTVSTPTTSPPATPGAAELARTGPGGNVVAMSRLGSASVILGLMLLVVAAETPRRAWRLLQRPTGRHYHRG
ncbi:MAG TPA: Ig-like domain-containing protein [Acidimicrobiales bacterium]|nr:Ig-like domain-containing protein [Acidimicrobiales bacterium]